MYTGVWGRDMGVEDFRRHSHRKINLRSQMDVRSYEAGRDNERERGPTKMGEIANIV